MGSRTGRAVTTTRDKNKGLLYVYVRAFQRLVRLILSLPDELLLQYISVKALGKPEKRDQQSVQRWIAQQNFLEGEDAELFLYLDDLVSAKRTFESVARSNPIENWLESSMANNPDSKMAVCHDLVGY